jgi:hypothetical protein
LRQRGRNEPARHEFGKRDGAADGRAHRDQPAAAEEAAPAHRAAAAKYLRVGALGVGAIEFVDRLLDLAGHGHSPWLFFLWSVVIRSIN